MTSGALIELAFGTRPNFVKVAPVRRALADLLGAGSVRLVHTGQHYDDALAAHLEDLGIGAPDVRLGAGSGTHGAQLATMLERYERHLLSLDVRPRGVVVFGDSNSTFACALAAARLGLPVAHVEAGLRSFDAAMPEEQNRRMTDVLASIHFATEPAAVANLLAERAPADGIFLVGNVMIDTLSRELAAARALGTARSLGLTPGAYAYATLHRASNVDDPEVLGRLVALLLRVSSRVPVAFPVHPRTRNRILAAGLGDALAAGGVRAIEPLRYHDNVALMDGAAVVLTDSGGVQEEAAWLGVPCVTLRSSTERPITVELGRNHVVGGDEAAALAVVDAALAAGRPMAPQIPLWDGRAAERIATTLRRAWA